MKTTRRLSLIGTIICLISFVIYIGIALELHYQTADSLWGFAGEQVETLNQIDAESPSAGYVALGHLAVGAIGFFGGLLAFLLSFFLIFLALYQIPAIISGFVAYRRDKKGYEIARCLKGYKTDGYIKAIMNGIVLGLVIIGTVGEIGDMSLEDVVILLVMLWNYMIVFGLSIFQICAYKSQMKEIR